MNVNPTTVAVPAVSGWRLFLYGLAIVILLAALFVSAGAAIGQSSARNSLGCWGLFTAGGDQRSTALHRIRDEITFVGSGMAGTTNKIRVNSYSILAAWRPITGTPQAPIQNTTTRYLPVVMDAWNFPLSNLCS